MKPTPSQSIKGMLKIGISIPVKMGDKGLIWQHRETKKLHREDGPAVEWHTGRLEYWVEGKRHRLDGPAIVMGSHQEYWINGEKFDKVSDFNFRVWSLKRGYLS